MNESGFFAVAVMIVIVAFLMVSGQFQSSSQQGSSATSTLPRSAVMTTTGSAANPSGASGTAGTPVKATTISSSATSTYAGLVRLNYGNHTARTVREQFIRVDTTYLLKEPVSITGWRLESARSGKRVTIGYGSNLPNLGDTATEHIVLRPGDYAYVISGPSPEGGLSFRDNKCTGYFTVTQRFYPNVSGSCPRPTAEIPYQAVEWYDGRVEECADYVRSLPYCSIIPAVPQRFAGACQEYISQHFSYPGCVNDFKNDPDFYLNHWFIYVNQNEPLWRSTHDTVVLYDAAGKPVDYFVY
jgi:hypothetical protein